MVGARVPAALGAGLYTPSATAAASSIAKPEERGCALTLVLGGLTVASAVGVPLGTFIGQAVNWRITFAFAAALGVIALIYLIFGVTAVICSFSAGWLIDHMSPVRIAALALVGLAVMHTAFAVTSWTAHGSAAAACVLIALAVLLASSAREILPARGGARSPTRARRRCP
jgi:predicted MFS family arabinose efflux permease